jgi:hypothetical protein
MRNRICHGYISVVPAALLEMQNESDAIKVKGAKQHAKCIGDRIWSIWR